MDEERDDRMVVGLAVVIGEVVEVVLIVVMGESSKGGSNMSRIGMLSLLCRKLEVSG